MSLSRIFTRAQLGIEAPPVLVEVHISNGLPMVGIVGLAETSVKESRDRVRSAILNSGFEFPSARRVLVSLSPADLTKSGGRYDLAIAMGILVASGQISTEAIEQHEFAGELGLNGELRSCPGMLPFAIGCAAADKKMVLPLTDLAQASLVENATLLGAVSLLQVCRYLEKSEQLPSRHQRKQRLPATPPDLADVKGQFHARRSLEIAAAGGHNLFMSGPPGTGKTMLASRLPGILPQLNNAEALEVASIYSVCARRTDFIESGERPFRNPHHTASGVALVGGGSNPKPGEISLAHHGVLFLDELAEYDRRVLDVLREPLETGEIHISRANLQIRYPAQFQLVAAMNPCPCGYLGTSRACGTCTSAQIAKYNARISGPLLDRIDLHIEVPELKKDDFFADAGNAESSAEVRSRVLAARNRQLQRQSVCNNRLGGKQIEQVCKLGREEISLLQSTLEKLRLSARAFHKVLRVARTIADIAHSDTVSRQHILEAVSYRNSAKR